MAALPQEQPQSTTGLFQSLSNFAGSLIAIAHTRLQLLTTELQEEVRQVGAILLWAFIAAFTALLGLFLAALVVIFAFWDTHRIAASLAMIGMFVAIAIFAALDAAEETAQQAADARRHARRAREGSRQPEGTAMSQRFDQLHAHHSNLLARCAVQRRQLAESAEEIEHELGRVGSRAGRSPARATQPGIDRRRNRRRRAGRAAPVAALGYERTDALFERASAAQASPRIRRSSSDA